MGQGEEKNKPTSCVIRLWDSGVHDRVIGRRCCLRKAGNFGLSHIGFVVTMTTRQWPYENRAKGHRDVTARCESSSHAV